MAIKSTLNKTSTFKSVVLIDDDRTNNMLFEKMSKLASLTDDLLVISDPVDALDHFKSTDNIPDAIFIDLQMPMLDGWEVLESIRINKKLDKAKVFIFSTGINYRDEQKAEDDERVTKFLSKPISLNTLKDIGKYC